MKKEKSVLEEALLEVDSLEAAVKQNAKGILESTMRDELNDLLKEEDEKEEEVDESEGGLKDLTNPKEVSESDGFEGGQADLKNPKTSEPGKGKETKGNDHEGGLADLKNPKTELPEQEEEDLPVDDSEVENPVDDDSVLDDELPIDGDVESEETFDDEVLDMTDAPHEDILKVFKSMKPEDGVIVKKDGENLQLDIDGEEYMIKLDDVGEETPDEDDVPPIPAEDGLGDMGGDEFGSEEAGGEEGLDMGDDELATGDEIGDETEPEDELNETDETIYEIELSDDDFKIKDTDGGEDVAEGEEEVEEAMRTKSNLHGDKNDAQSRAGIKGKTMYQAGSGKLNEEFKKLKKQNGDYKKALVQFKDKLQEIALFNSNLAYSTRLFTEHSTTKNEKLSILKRFDSVKTKEGSKNLFEQINSELNGTKTIAESATDKITSTPKTSSSKEVLSESKAYENPQFARMRELMGKIK